jgi:hypothetical protein
MGLVMFMLAEVNPGATNVYAEIPWLSREAKWDRMVVVASQKGSFPERGIVPRSAVATAKGVDGKARIVIEVMMPKVEPPP